MFSTISVGIAQNIFVSSLSKRIASSTSAISPDAVIQVGATRLQKLNLSPVVFELVKAAFAYAVRNTIIFGLVVTCIAIPIAVLMEWKNIKVVAAAREQEHVEMNSESAVGETML
jgi:hypothetical protein